MDRLRRGGIDEAVRGLSKSGSSGECSDKWVGKDSIEVRKTTRGEAEHAFVHRYTEAVLVSLELARLSVCFFISLSLLLVAPLLHFFFTLLL